MPERLGNRLAIVPAYNEEESVARVVTAIHEQCPDFDVLVVDDGSTDRTAEQAERAGATVIQHPFNLGIGGAVQTGYKYAQRNAYDLAAQVDGDGQHDPGYLPTLTAALCDDDEIDMVTGSRFREGPGYKVPWVRRTGIMLFSGLMSLIVRQRVTDPDLRVSHDEPPRHRALCARLPARLPRGRGHLADARTSPAHARGSGAHERAAQRTLVDHESAQRLLHAQGAACRARRPVPLASGDRPGIRRTGRRTEGHLVDSRIQSIAVVVTALLLLLVFELVRRRRLMERYALLWLLSAVVLLVLAAWTGLLDKLSGWVGIATPSNTLFVVGFAFVLALLLNFSLAVSRLSDESKILAQQVARLDQELRDARKRLAEAEQGNYPEHVDAPTVRRQEETVGER